MFLHGKHFFYLIDIKNSIDSTLRLIIKFELCCMWIKVCSDLWTKNGFNQISVFSLRIKWNISNERSRTSVENLLCKWIVHLYLKRKVSLDPMDSNWFYLLRKFLASKVIQTKQPSLKWKCQQQTLPNGLHDILVEAHKYSHVIINRGKKIIHKLFARTTLLFHVLESRAQFPRRNHTNTFQPRFSYPR